MTDIQTQELKIKEALKKLYQLKTELLKLKAAKINKKTRKRRITTNIVLIEKILANKKNGLHLNDIFKKINKNSDITYNVLRGTLNNYCKKYKLFKKNAPHTYSLINE